MVRHWLAAACYPVVYAPRSLFAGKLGTARHVVTQGVLPARPASLRLPASLDSDVDERYGRRRRMLECSLARSESLPGVAEERAPYLPAPRLLDRVRIAIRTRHLSPRTEEADVFWIRRFILFHHKRHPAQMAASEVT